MASMTCRSPMKLAIPNESPTLWVGQGIGVVEFLNDAAPSQLFRQEEVRTRWKKSVSSSFCSFHLLCGQCIRPGSTITDSNGGFRFSI